MLNHGRLLHIGRRIADDQPEEGSKAEHDQEIPRYRGNVGRFEGGQVQTSLKHLLEPLRQVKGHLNNDIARKEVLDALHHDHVLDHECHLPFHPLHRSHGIHGIESVSTLFLLGLVLLGPLGLVPQESSLGVGRGTDAALSGVKAAAGLPLGRVEVSSASAHQTLRPLQVGPAPGLGEVNLARLGPQQLPEIRPEKTGGDHYYQEGKDDFFRCTMMRGQDRPSGGE